MIERKLSKDVDMLDMHVGAGGEHVIRGGYRSVRSTQHGESERSRRQLSRWLELE